MALPMMRTGAPFGAGPDAGFDAAVAGDMSMLPEMTA
jgi:hypothetical protein